MSQTQLFNFKTENTTIKRGSLSFRKPGEVGWTFFGQCPSVSLTSQVQNSELYSSNTPIKQLMNRVVIQVDSTLSLTTNNISKEVLAMFFNGSSSQQKISALTNISETFPVETLSANKFYTLGDVSGNAFVSNASITSIVNNKTAYSVSGISVSSGGSGYVVGDLINISGIGTVAVTAVNSGAVSTISTSNLASGLATDPSNTSLAVTGGTGTGLKVAVTSTKSSGIPLVEGVDYNFDSETANISILIDTVQNLSISDTFTVVWSSIASIRDISLSGSDQVKCSLRYIENNPDGTNQRWEFANATISANGDLQLNGTDYATIGLTATLLQVGNQPSITVDGVSKYKNESF